MALADREHQLAKTLLEIELLWEDAPLHLFATHLASRWNPQELADDVVTIIDLLAPVADSPHVLVGDMNALRPGDPVGTPPAGETNAAMRLMAQFGWRFAACWTLAT